MCCGYTKKAPLVYVCGEDWLLLSDVDPLSLSLLRPTAHICRVVTITEKELQLLPLATHSSHLGSLWNIC